MDADTAKNKDDVTKYQRYIDEITDFITTIERCIEKGPDDSVECEAQYNPIQRDGVMVNSAPLYPLLEPQWSGDNAPKMWWKTLCKKS